MTRLNIIVEGDAEERFVNEVLSPHFGGFGITTSASKVVTSGRRGNAAAQGGGRRYGHWKDDLSSWIKAQGRDQSVWFTTMLDYYGLGAFVDEFPGYRETAGERRANDRVAKWILAGVVPQLPHLAAQTRLTAAQIASQRLPECSAMPP